MSDIEDVKVCVVFKDSAANLSQLVPCQAETIEAGEVLQLLAEDRPDPVLPEVEGPQLGQSVDVLRDCVQVVVVESEVLQQRTAGEEAGREDGQSVVVHGQGGQRGQAGQGGDRQLRQLVVREQEDMEVDEVTEGVVGNIGDVVVLEVQYLEVVLLSQCPPLQFGESVVAEVQRHQFRQSCKLNLTTVQSY